LFVAPKEAFHYLAHDEKHHPAHFCGGGRAAAVWLIIRPSDSPQTPFNDSYYNRDYWNGVNGVAPANNPLRDPLVGTVFENVAPY
jgi:hypothetical protein